MLTERFDEAFHYAHRLHRTQMRKGTPIPYISHLMTVAALVVEHGGNEDQAIGALLHDAAEDQGGVETLHDIRRRFGDAVAEIVSDCTDLGPNPNRTGDRAKKPISLSCRQSPGNPCSSRLPTKPIMPKPSSLTIASWAIRSGSGSTAARRVRAGITALWLMCSPKQCPADCRTAYRGRWRPSRFEKCLLSRAMDYRDRLFGS